MTTSEDIQMRKVQIITDSCSDLTPELMERYHIAYAKMTTILEGKSSPADLAWTAEDAHNFYDIMREGKRITTTQVPPEEFDRVFRKYLDENFDIVYIGCSLKQSGSVNTAAVIAKKLAPEYPEAEIYCIDSLRASLGEGMLAMEAAKFAKDGVSAAEVAKYTSEMRNHVREYVAVHTLDYLKRAGRVKASAAFFGNLLGVKPIITADADGEQTAYKKAKGRAASLAEAVALLKEHIKDAAGQTVYIAHADCDKEELDAMRQTLLSEIGCHDVYTAYMGPIIGASIGPGAMAIFALGEEQTFRIGEE